MNDFDDGPPTLPSISGGVTCQDCGNPLTVRLRYNELHYIMQCPNEDCAVYYECVFSKKRVTRDGQ